MVNQTSLTKIEGEKSVVPAFFKKIYSLLKSSEKF